MRADCKNELLSFLKEKHEKLDAVVMPDFFYDRLINLNCDAALFSSVIADITERKGGSIDGIAQMDIRGGNAINTASALAALGVNVTPIVCTNKRGLQQIKVYLGKYRIDLSHVKIAEKASLTTALELKTENGKANVMLRDLGALANFGPLDLTDSDYGLIENADYVCLFNWAGTKKYGTRLAETVFRRVKTKGKGKTYYDTADPTPNRDEIPELVNNVLKTSKVNVLSLNENEALCYASMLTDEISGNQQKRRFDELAMEAARVLAKNLPARIDLHTTVFSATFTKKTEVVVPSFKVKALRATGAGDAWNAGNILGDGNALSDECRLVLANAVSAYYLSDPYGAHPTRRKLVKFIDNSALNSPVLG
ncbi:carbohydrate kinase family protein [Candidatus Bathyarchaeota archaeon]|nr:carbohydrate kinase family protein [Candidatus Bathyarchaeota archaeon]